LHSTANDCVRISSKETDGVLSTVTLKNRSTVAACKSTVTKTAASVDYKYT